MGILIKMTLEIHGMGGSAPCRIPYMTCEVLGLDYKMVNCDLMKGDHKTPEYLKMNPQHTIPTMKDGDFCMNESRPIATYLASKYGKDDKLYPIMFGGPTPGQDKMDRFKEVMGWVEDFIKPTGYVAGTDHMTVADIAWLATYSTIVASEHFDLSS